jgi:hypothetical protein
LKGRGISHTANGSKMNLGFKGCEKTPLTRRFVSGHDFSRADETARKCRALAPAVFVFSYLQFRSG